MTTSGSVAVALATPAAPLVTSRKSSHSSDSARRTERRVLSALAMSRIELGINEAPSLMVDSDGAAERAKTRAHRETSLGATQDARQRKCHRYHESLANVHLLPRELA
jgi:hypothetical protein